MLQSLERLKPRNFGGWKQNVNTAILGFGLDFCPLVQNGFAPTQLLEDAALRDGLPDQLGILSHWRKW